MVDLSVGEETAQKGRKHNDLVVISIVVGCRSCGHQAVASGDRRTQLGDITRNRR